MRSIKGDLGLMELSELLQWAETGQKDGTLIISQGMAGKYLFFQNGKLIFFSSQVEKERIGNALFTGKHIGHSQLLTAITASKKLGIPFITYLISEKIISEETIRQVMTDLVQNVITEALQWNDGKFEFREVIPEAVLNGPIKLNITKMLFKSAVQVDEKNGVEERQSERIVDEIIRRLQSGRIELPPPPALMQKLNNATRNNSTSAVEIGQMIMVDQILTTKILKVVNSPFYHLAGDITSLPHAINIIGLSSVKSIALAHSLSQMSPGNERKILPVLQHSLLTAFIANKFSALLKLNPDDIFVCGILHDIGKTVLINFLASHDLSADQYNNILTNQHAQIGYLLAVEWKFAGVVQETTRFHHTPALAEHFPKQVMVIHFANRLANEQNTQTCLPAICEAFQLPELPVASVLEQIEGLFNLPAALV